MSSALLGCYNVVVMLFLFHSSLGGASNTKYQLGCDLAFLYVLEFSERSRTLVVTLRIGFEDTASFDPRYESQRVV